MASYRILVVDDEEDLCEILKFNLTNSGYDVCSVNSAEEALMLNLSSFHLLVLDVMMGEISGFKMAEMLKENPQTMNIPILFLTALGEEGNVVEGFHLGADDYVTKPFSLNQVQLRIKAILKRVYAGEEEKTESDTIVYKGLVLDLRSKSTKIDGELIDLTKKEFDILKLLLENIGKVFSREDILHYVWTDEVIVLGRTIDVNITRMRKKLGPYGFHIVTRQGFGYLFEDEN